MSLVFAGVCSQGPPLTPLKRAWKFGESLRRAGATAGCPREVLFYEPIPIFAVGCTVGIVQL